MLILTQLNLPSLLDKLPTLVMGVPPRKVWFWGAKTKIKSIYLLAVEDFGAHQVFGPGYECGRFDG